MAGWMFGKERWPGKKNSGALLARIYFLASLFSPAFPSRQREERKLQFKQRQEENKRRQAELQAEQERQQKREMEVRTREDHGSAGRSLLRTLTGLSFTVVFLICHAFHSTLLFPAASGANGS